jgi:Putative transposase
LLPTPSFHTVFTVPHDLNALILGNKRRLLTLLFRAVSQTLLPFGKQNLHGQLGATLGLHTWEQTRNAHFHLHGLVPAGALAEDGTRWVPTHPRFLFPVQALSTVFVRGASPGPRRSGPLHPPHRDGPSSPPGCP